MTNSISNPAVPTNPYHIARAYAQAAPARAAAPAPTAGARAEIGIATAPVGKVQPAQPVTTGALPTPARKDSIDQLVAAIVPGKAQFDGAGVALRAVDVLPMYRNPTEKNEVNTVLLVGRGIDTTG